MRGPTGAVSDADARLSELGLDPRRPMPIPMPPATGSHDCANISAFPAAAMPIPIRARCSIAAAAMGATADPEAQVDGAVRTLFGVDPLSVPLVIRSCRRPSATRDVAEY